MNSVTILRLYYLFLLALLLPGIWDTVAATFMNLTLLPPADFVELISWVPRDFFGFFKKSVALATLISLVICTAYPWRRFSRILVPFCLLFWIGIISSYGKIIHGFQGWFFSSLVLIFLTRQTFSKIFFVAQFCAILGYSSAGMWKIRRGISVIEQIGFPGYQRVLGNAIASEHGFHGYEVTPLVNYLLDHDELTAVLFFCLVLLQLGAPVLALFRRAHIWLGMGFVLFHAASELILNIPFRAQMGLMVVMYIVPGVVNWTTVKMNKYSI